jgi:CelD/BcsL family acetyltransferase involved in cellulose biosynthesis
VSAETRFSLEPIASGDAMEAPWRELEGSGAGSFFTSWSWIGTWLATLPREVRPALLHAREGGRTVGLAVAVLGERRRLGFPSRSLHLNATGDPRWDCIFIEHNGLLAADGRGDELTDRLVAWFAADGVGADAFHLDGIGRPAVTGPRLMQRIETRTGFAVALQRLSAAGEDPAAALSRNARQQLRRALRAYEALGTLSLVEAASVEQALAFFREMKALHIASWERRRRPHAFREAYFERFHSALIERCFAEGTVQLLRASAGAEAFGYLYNFRRNGRIYAYQSGFAAAGPGLRPGVVSHYLALVHNLRRGEAVYDFLAGRNQLKASFATESYALCWQVVERRRLAFRLEAAARAVKQRLIRRRFGGGLE